MYSARIGTSAASPAACHAIPGRHRHVTPAGARPTVATRAAFSDDREVAGPPPALPLSFFTPYKSLPPDGQTIPPKEESCDVMVQRCKTLAYVWETPCPMCHGTGHARTSSNATSRPPRRTPLHTCIVCMGMGHVRRTTAREPLLDTLEGGTSVTMARTQRLPGEPEEQPVAKGGVSYSSMQQRIVKKAEELSEQQQNNIVSGAGLSASKKQPAV